MDTLERRGKGRPRKDEYLLDKDGNHVFDEKGKKILKAAVPEMRDIPEDEPEVPNQVASQSADNDAVRALVEEVRTLRAQVEAQAPHREQATGTWDYDYSRQSHLRVMGGLEVNHPEFTSGEKLPLPPSGIPRYKAKGGGTTDHIEAPTKKFIKYDATGANPLLDEHGQPQFTEVPVAKAAELDAAGNPILTDEYKFWLHEKARGRRLSGNAMTDIAAGKGVPDGAVVQSDVLIGDNGIPVTNDD